MALKVFHFFCFIFLIFLDFSSIGNAKIEISNDKITAPFTFLDHLQGCHKGNKTKGINQLKTYLQKFGYLDGNQIHVNDDNFDDALEYAVKTYQQNYHIKPTGKLDAKTVSKMTSPRCGFADIVNGTNSMQPSKKRHGSSSNSSFIHTVSNYTFFSGNLRWPPSTTHLTYGFSPGTPNRVRAPVGCAFRTWASATNFTFSFVRNYRNANLIIGFHRLDHGDGAPFDGPGGVLAHAFAPTDGRFHYDADERWSIGPVVDAFDLESVALHEIGHLLGLGHSSVEEAIMYPSIHRGVTKNNLHEDDIQGITSLYNA